MVEILVKTWAALVSVLSGLWSILETALVWVGDVLYTLHVSAPRTEGLLIGIFLTWVFLRRDRHPLLRVLSAPLKLVVDILDLLWDQLVEVCTDIKSAVANWVGGVVGWAKQKCISVWSGLMSRLRSVKERLSKRNSESESE